MISLNLLPRERKELFRWRQYTKKIILNGGKLIFLLFCFFIPFLSIYIYLFGEINSLDSQIGLYENTANMRQLNSLEKSFKEINNMFVKINKISENQIYWTSVIEELTAIMPLNVQIISLQIEPDGKFIIIGNAATREDVLEFGKRLKNSTDFGDIQTPLDNLIKRNDIDFKFSGTIILDNFIAKEKVRLQTTDQI